MSVAQQRTPVSTFPALFAALYCGVIAYVSMEPFAGWSAPPNGLFASLISSPRSWRGQWFDIPLNVLGYLPIGFALGFVFARRWHAVALGGALSIAMECVQAWLPMRHASLVDVGVNVIGTWLGTLLTSVLRSSRIIHSSFGRFRRHLLPGVRGDYGLLLLLVFWFAHLSPGLSLFSSTIFLPETAGKQEPAMVLVQALQTGLLFLGFALFADLLARTRLGGALMTLFAVLVAISTKSLIAAWLLRPGLWGDWLSPPVMLGMVLGMVTQFALFWFPASTKRVVCNVVIIVATVLPVLIPDWLMARAPARSFDWSYGHLLNFNTLSQTLLRIWPLFASMYLISTAGNAFQDRVSPSSSSI